MKWGSRTAVRELNVENWEEIQAASEYYAKQPFAIPSLIRFTESRIKTYRELLSRQDVPRVTDDVRRLAKERVKNGLCAFSPEDIRLLNIKESFFTASLFSVVNLLLTHSNRRSAALKRITKFFSNQENIAKSLGIAVSNANGKRYETIAKLSKELKVKKDFLDMFLMLLSSTFVLAFKKDFGDVQVKVEDARNSCPFCGSNPMIGIIDKNDSSLFLVCSACGTEWRYPRIRCTNCGNTDFNTLEMLYIGGEESPHRIHTCKKCNHYIKLIDDKARNEPFGVFPALLDAATVYLDIIAEKRGLDRRGGSLEGGAKEQKKRKEVER